MSALSRLGFGIWTLAISSGIVILGVVVITLALISSHDFPLVRTFPFVYVIDEKISFLFRILLWTAPAPLVAPIR